MTTQPTTNHATNRLPLTLDQTAAVLGISREAVRLRLRRGTLSGERRGGHWMVWSVDAPTQPTSDQPTASNLRRSRPTDQHDREVGRLEQLVRQVEGERDRLVVELEARRREVATYQRQAENYQVLLLRAGVTLVGPVTTDRPTDQPRRPWWRWWRR